MITYESTPYNLRVYLEGKLVGAIWQVDGGYQYTVRGRVPFKIASRKAHGHPPCIGARGGAVFTTIEAVKASLEAA